MKLEHGLDHRDVAASYFTLAVVRFEQKEFDKVVLYSSSLEPLLV